MKDILNTRQFENLIFEFRGSKVMIDADLASLYETETKKLKQQVKRNLDSFPSDFMPACPAGRFEFSNEEKEQLVTNCD
ncbi:ORF6N domain-containing protein [Daejeonella sp.]|uniref:ORF6N domain-containing protein n=1 Tax=Daejeonella sp. TaxID=2805397 RepID=UPI0030C362B3